MRIDCKTLSLSACLFALLCLSSVGYASQPSSDVHFCRVLDFEDMQARDSLYVAPKQTFNLNAGEPRTVRMMDDFVNFSPRTWSPFFPSKGLLLGGSYVNRNDDSNSYLKSNNSSEVVESYVGERARQVIIAKGRYVRVTYRKDNGESETVEGFVQAMDATELTIYRGVWRKKIPKDRIRALMILNHLSQRQSSRLKDYSYSWIITGFFGGAIGWTVGSEIGGAGCEQGDDFCGLEAIEGGIIGALIGSATGVVAGLVILRDQKPHGPFGVAMKGSLMGLGAGTVMAMAVNRKLWPSMLIGPVVGGAIMSRWSRDIIDPRRFSVGFAPDRDGNLSALATFRF